MTIMTASLAKYAKVFTIGVQNTFVYRWAFVLRSVVGIVPLIGTLFLWQAVFSGGGGTVAGYGMNAMILYFAMTVLMENLVTPTDDEWQIAAEIRDGRLSALLLKPLNYIGYRFSLYTSYRMLYSVILAPGVLVVFFFLREYIILPTNPATWLAFGVSTVLAALLQFFIAVTIAMLAFWILEISTIIFITYSFEYFLSGRIFPLDMLPPWLSGFVKWAPFTYELYFPVQIFMERVKGEALREGLMIQAGWVLIMWVAALTLWKRGVKKYQAVGG
jgi:ABC-2 type transport system permease protein